VDGQTRRIGITRVHLEEDAGKLIHDEQGGQYSLVDYNRTGVPLMEIVSEPDLQTPAEAKAYLEKLKAILQYLEVSDCKMEEGSLRCDANVSIRPVGSTQLGVKAEIKNMNSFKALQRALEYEIERQIEVLREGGRIIQETRMWDENRGVTLSMRSKEEAHDYRYFPEPDLVPLVIDQEWINRVTRTLPEFPHQRQKRLVEEYGLPPYDAGVITASKAVSDFFDACVALYPQPKTVSNWVMGELLRLLNARGMEAEDNPVKPGGLVSLLQLMDQGTVSGKIAKQVFEEMFDTGQPPEEIIQAKGLVQISDQSELETVVEKVIAENPRSVEDYRQGKEKALGFLVGQVMKETRGKANPQVVNQLLREKL
jgi:aspartyl-tRNA(Asn)/glutamyl-tRNA(Gln) amidotransferase subunit B